MNYGNTSVIQRGMMTRRKVKPEPADSDEASPAPRERITVLLPPDLTERMRNAAFWTPGDTLTEITRRGVEAEIDRMEGERGEPFPERSAPVRIGRPPKR